MAEIKQIYRPDAANKIYAKMEHHMLYPTVETQFYKFTMQIKLVGTD
jgi:hypothetical protein